MARNGTRGNTRPLVPLRRSHFSISRQPNKSLFQMGMDLLCDESLCLSSEDAASETSRRSTSGQRQEDTRSRARNWCFTINNPTQEEKDNLHVLSLTSPDVRYLAFQLEEGADGTRHIQGYIEMTSAWRFQRLKSLISQRSHVEMRRGTRTQARDYVMKEDSRVEGPWEYGTWSPDESPAKATANQIRELVAQGKRETDLWEQHFGWMARYYRGVREYVRIRTMPRSTKTRVIILYGPTRTGKSRWCMENLTDIYWKPRGEWWDGYTNEQSVVIDDFYGWIKYDELLRLGDRYPLLVPTKGGYSQFTASTIAITSNRLPKDWYKNIEDMSAFYARVEEWHYITQDNHQTFNNYNAFNLITRQQLN